MNEQERKFVASIQEKIKKYDIPITIKDAFKNASGIITNTVYADNTTEVVDSGIESYLMTISFCYWLNNYTLCDIPNKGTVAFKPYYYQSEMAKEIGKYRKIVIDKTRQCLTKNNFINTQRGIISIKDAKIGDIVETISNGKRVFTPILDFIPQGKKCVYKTITHFGLELECTGDHKVLTSDGWKEIADVSVSDLLVTVNGLDAVKSVVKLDEELDVYDITTGTHDFLANGIVVHNCGMSTVFSLYCLWRLLAKPSENIDVVSLTQLKAQEFIKKFKTTLGIQPSFFLKEQIENNKQKIRFKHPNGEISSITSESQTENAGRADSLSLLVLDELAFYKSDRMVQSIISAAIPTLTKTGGQQIYISTPNSTVGAGAYYYNQVQEAKMGLDPNTKYMQIGWWEIGDDPAIPGPKKGYNKELEQAIKDNYYYDSVARKKWDDFFEPIGKDPNSNPFLKSQFGSLGDFKYRQEILHEFIISGDRAFTPDTMMKIKAKIKPPIEKDYLCLNGRRMKEMHNFWIWKHPQPSGRYIVAVDPSQGTSQDRACIQVLDIENMEQVAEFYGFAATTQLPVMIKDIARVYNDAYVVIEANSIGDGVFNALYYNQNDPYGNVFKQKKSSNGITRYTGWITDVKTRKLMTTEVYDWFSNAEMFSRIQLNSERVYSEFETWIVDSKGKFIHASSCHDDSIMALGLALYNRNKALQSSQSSMGFVDEDGNIISYDRNEYEKGLKDSAPKSGIAVNTASHNNELSSIMDDGRRRLNLDDTNYAGMYGSNESFASGGNASQNRAVQDRLGLADMSVYDWLIG